MTVKVKQLEWLPTTDGEHMNGHTNRRMMAKASTSFGTYHIELGSNGWHCLFNTLAGHFAGPLNTEKDARDAVQADYESRIISALSLDDSREEGEPVAWITSSGILELSRGKPAYVQPEHGSSVSGRTPLFTRPDDGKMREEVEKLREALKALLNRDERNTCQHENTHRGGFLWEICDECGAKWADDEGGRPVWVEPPEWLAARAALSQPTKEG